MSQATANAVLKLRLTSAQIFNARFNTNASVFVTAKQRIDDYCKMVPGARTELLNAIKDFKKNNPNLTAKTMKLARAEKAKLNDIRIDDTMNRPLNWDHVLRIIKNFSATRIMAVNVYEDPQAPNCWIAWDGQHTTVVLYIIYSMIFEEAVGSVEIPIVIAPSNEKSFIRENFIYLNTDERDGGGKRGLDPLDLFTQKVFGVRMDGSTNPDWESAEIKQKMLESADVFLTSVAYQNTDEDGAITHVSSIIEESEKVVEIFCKYWSERKKYQNRHVETKEIIMINNLIKACLEDPKCTVDDKFVEDMAKIFWDTFECEFTGQKGLNKFWRKLDTAYQNWYDKVFKVPKKGEEDLRPTRYVMTKNGKHQDIYGTTFMIFILKNNGFAHHLPKPLCEFKPAKSDLW